MSSLLSNVVLPLKAQVLDLGLFLNAQVVVVAKFAFYQLWLVCSFLYRRDVVTVTHAVITSRLSFCNMFCWVALKTAQTLQSFQKSAHKSISLAWPRKIYHANAKTVALDASLLPGPSQSAV